MMTLCHAYKYFICHMQTDKNIGYNVAGLPSRIHLYSYKDLIASE